jgi:hypothetical protein
MDRGKRRSGHGWRSAQSQWARPREATHKSRDDAVDGIVGNLADDATAYRLISC